jgi:hypothetical protein
VTPGPAVHAHLCLECGLGVDGCSCAFASERLTICPACPRTTSAPAPAPPAGKTIQVRCPHSEPICEPCLVELRAYIWGEFEAIYRGPRRRSA